MQTWIFIKDENKFEKKKERKKLMFIGNVVWKIDWTTKKSNKLETTVKIGQVPSVTYNI